MRDAPDIRASVGLAYGGLRILVQSSRVGDVRWLQEFLAPSFRIGTQDAYDCRVVLCADSTRYADSLRHGAQIDDAALDCFVNDTHIVRLPVWRGVDGLTTVFDAQYAIICRVSADRRDIVLETPTESVTARTFLMRVVRELAMSHARRRGGLFLHAAAVTAAGRGVIIAGQKSAGKTTLLLHLLQQENVDYVSNDRVLVSFDSAPPTLRGMPTIISLRPAMLQLFPALHERLLPSAGHAQLSLAELSLQAPESGRPWRDGRWGLSPPQLCALLEATPVAASPAAALVFPRITEAAGTIRVSQLSAREAAGRMRDVMLGAGVATKTSDVFTLPADPPAPDEAALTRLSQRLASEIACFEWQLGEHAYEHGSQAAALLDRLVA